MRPLLTPMDEGEEAPTIRSLSKVATRGLVPLMTLEELKMVAKTAAKMAKKAKAKAKVATEKVAKMRPKVEKAETRGAEVVDEVVARVGTLPTTKISSEEAITWGGGPR